MATKEAVTDSGDPSQGRRSRSFLNRNQLIVMLAVAAVILIGRLTPFAPVQDVFHVFGWFTAKAIGIAGELFERWGYPTVFLAPMLENTLFIGALIPGTLVMLLAGLAVNDGSISYWWAIPLATAGAIIGDTISYSMGRFGARRLGQESRFVRWAEDMREPLMRHSLWLILTYHFAGYSRLIGPAAAGFLRMPFGRWAVLDYVGVFIWVTTFITGGYLLARVFGIHLDEDSDRSVQVFEVVLFAFFVIAVVSIMRATSSRQKRAAKEQEHANEITSGE